MTLSQLARNGVDFQYWYDDAWTSIQRVCRCKDWNPYLFAAVLAATSPRSQVTRNVRNTIHYFETGELLRGSMAGHRVAVDRLRDGTRHMVDRLRGPKVRTFYSALTGDRYAVTLDSWMSVACGLTNERGKPLDWTPARIQRETARVNRVAKRLRLFPRDCQAAIWTGAIRYAGRQPRRLSVWREFTNLDWRE